MINCYDCKSNIKCKVHRQHEGLLAWVCDHTEDIADYARALLNCDFTEDEVADELSMCGLKPEEIEKIIEKIMEELNE